MTNSLDFEPRNAQLIELKRKGFAHNLVLQTLLQQLAKDHDTHPFHTLATALASYAVEQVGRTMLNRWNGQQEGDPAQQAYHFIGHPNDSTWQDEIVIAWAKQNPEKIRQGQSATALEYIYKEYVTNTMDRVKN